MLRPMKLSIQESRTWYQVRTRGDSAGTKYFGQRNRAHGAWLICSQGFRPKERKNHTDPNVKRSPGTRSRGPCLTFRSLVTAQTTATPTETCMIPFSDVGGSTTDQELPTRPQKKARAAPISARSPPSARAAPRQRARPPHQRGRQGWAPGAGSSECESAHLWGRSC